MKEFRVDFTQTGTAYEYCSAWVEAETREEAIEAVKAWDWNKIKDTDTYDTDYGDDFTVTEVEIAEEIEKDDD